MPLAGESHLHVMNGLGCPVRIRVSNANGEFNFHADVETRMNNIVYDIGPGLYDLDVRVDNACQQVDEFIKRYSFEAKDEKVTEGRVTQSFLLTA